MISTRFPGQLTVEQLVDRYDLACRPVRDLLVDYLRERQPGIDYSTLTGLATTLALWFWKDLENPSPGHRLAAAAARHRRRVEAAHPDQDRPHSRRRRAGRHQGSSRRHPDHRPGVLSRPRPVGAGRPRPLGTVGGALPGPRQRHPVQEAEVADQGPHGPADPRTAPRPARPRRRRRPRTQGRRSPAGRRPRHPARRAVHRRRADAAPGPPGPSLPPASGPKTQAAGSDGT